MAEFKRGDAVTFVTKYGDRATAVYLEPSTTPGIDGPVSGHTVVSDDCFGPDHMKSTGRVQCFVTRGLTLIEGDEAKAVVARIRRGYRFDMVCPRCNRESTDIKEARDPAPEMNCGECLMTDVEVVRFKVVAVTEVF